MCMYNTQTGETQPLSMSSGQHILINGYICVGSWLEMIQVVHLEKEINVLFNDALNTF